MTTAEPQGYRDNAPEAARAPEPDVAAQRAQSVARQETRVLALEAERARYEALCTSGVSIWSRLASVASLALFLPAMVLFFDHEGKKRTDGDLVAFMLTCSIIGFAVEHATMWLCRRAYRAPIARLDRQLVDARARYRERVLVAALPLHPETRQRVALLPAPSRQRVRDDDAALADEEAAVSSSRRHNRG